MKRILFLFAVLTDSLQTLAQSTKYKTTTGHIWLTSVSPLETIEAHNRQVIALLDKSTGSIAYKVVMKSFEFKKAAMQDHFNTQYLHTDKYPNATFDGKFTNPSAVSYDKDGSYSVEASGKLTIHGVTKEIKEKGTVTVKGNAVSTKSTFTINLADYNVTIPSNYVNNISKTITITVDCTLTLQ
ncbi:MAG: YceI family protein [Flavobacteriales bacterium]